MINASFNGNTYNNVQKLVATDGTNVAEVVLSESGVIPEPTQTKNITENGNNIDVKNFAKANVNVPNSYTQVDEGKVVKNGALASQSSTTVTINGTYDTTENNSVTVNVSGGGPTPTGTKTFNISENGATSDDVSAFANVEINVAVPNTYTSSDAGKVVKNTGSAYELASQTARENAITINGTYDTTENNSVTVNVSGGSASLGTKTITANDTYDAQLDGFDGYRQVTVNVPTTGYSVSDVASGNFGANIIIPDVSVRQYAFANSTTIESVFCEVNKTDPNTGVNISIFRGDSALETFVAPYITAFNSTDCFNGCSALEGVDFGALLAGFPARCFNDCSSLTKIVLRRSDSIVVLNRIDCFDGTPFANGGTGGTVYVPNDLIETYKTANNWATLFGYGTVTFTAIEGSAYEHAYVDGTPIT